MKISLAARTSARKTLLNVLPLCGGGVFRLNRLMG